MWTGLIGDNVKYQLKSSLDDITVTDKILIAKTNEAASLEWERQQKQRKGVMLRILRNRLQLIQK